MLNYSVLLKCKRPEYRRILRAFKKKLTMYYLDHEGYKLNFAMNTSTEKEVVAAIVQKTLNQVNCEYEEL